MSSHHWEGAEKGLKGDRVQVSGMVERPAEFTVPELINALPSYTIPVTLVCAGGFLSSAGRCQLPPHGSLVMALC